MTERELVELTSIFGALAAVTVIAPSVVASALLPDAAAPAKETSVPEPTRNCTFLRVSTTWSPRFRVTV